MDKLSDYCKKCQSLFDQGVKCRLNECDKISKYIHCFKCGDHHDNLASKFHCIECKLYVNKNHKYCKECNKCMDLKRKHCFECEYCVVETYVHCLKCNKCHVNIECDLSKKKILKNYCLECKKDVLYLNHCIECNKCHDEDLIHCCKCKKLHYYFNKEYCIECKLCFESHQHCKRCNVAMIKRQNINENKVKYYLLEKYKKVECEKTFDWCLNESKTSHLRFDFYIDYMNLLVEYDGEQHFKQISNWDFNQTKCNDEKKNELVLNQGIKLIRINYKEMNNSNWKKVFKDDDRLIKFKESNEEEKLKMYKELLYGI